MIFENLKPSLRKFERFFLRGVALVVPVWVPVTCSLWMSMKPTYLRENIIVHFVLNIILMIQ